MSFSLSGWLVWWLFVGHHLTTRHAEKHAPDNRRGPGQRARRLSGVLWRYPNNMTNPHKNHSRGWMILKTPSSSPPRGLDWGNNTRTIEAVHSSSANAAAACCTLLWHAFRVNRISRQSHFAPCNSVSVLFCLPSNPHYSLPPQNHRRRRSPVVSPASSSINRPVVGTSYYACTYVHAYIHNTTAARGTQSNNIAGGWLAGGGVLCK